MIKKYKEFEGIKWYSKGEFTEDVNSNDNDFEDEEVDVIPLEVGYQKIVMLDDHCIYLTYTEFDDDGYAVGEASDELDLEDGETLHVDILGIFDNIAYVSIDDGNNFIGTGNLPLKKFKVIKK